MFETNLFTYLISSQPTNFPKTKYSTGDRPGLRLKLRFLQETGVFSYEVLRPLANTKAA